MQSVSKVLQRGALDLRGSLLQTLRAGQVSCMSRLQVRGNAKSAAAEAEDTDEHDAHLERSTIADILRNKKGEKERGSFLWCQTDDTVYDAVRQMTQHNVGALVVMKSGKDGIAGIITERDYLRKVAIENRTSKETKVGDIMTVEAKLVTVTPDTQVLQAMQLMTEHRIRHIPVVDDHKMHAMISIGDVVRAVVDEHREEVKRLNDYIQGGY
ncbi:cystathionine beta-synthase family protein [Klebsormidium nitens]|uniref:Cystathionine beta-synthase family protein n=1 Tax=Klebsormidium nitens TaxID=105231 RepID=A0A1Y1HWL4_KLENI|nr:cystathionine beta-synthase family protein [Klebsormidium nitens]|eukprot:GAQ80917.1 cystathionine beta-synthase family protein [Klebsormidium nitens]